MKNKILSVVLVVALVAALAVGASMAYLQDTDADVNVMVVGNVSIDQLEYERVVENGAWVSTGKVDKYGFTPDKIQEFTQAKPLLPAVFADGDIKWDDRAGADVHQQSWDQIGAPGSIQLFDDSVRNAQDKFVFVKNTGKTNAYVRTWFAFEQGKIPADRFSDVIMTNSDNSHWNWSSWTADVQIDGNVYVVVCATYAGPSSNPTGILAPGATSYASLTQVYMRPEATNEDVAALDGNGNGAYDILVLSQAIQADGFDNAEQALTAGFGADHPWGNGPVKLPQIVYNAEQLNEALNAGKDVYMEEDTNFPVTGNSNGYGGTGIRVTAGQTLDGQGNTLSVPGANTTWDSALSTNGGTIKDLTIDEGFRGIFITSGGEKVYLEKVILDGPTYTISCDSASGHGLDAVDSVFNGWTSYAGTLGPVSFTNCSFGEGAGYAFCRPYAPTTFVGCTFEDGYAMDARAAVTMIDCYYGDTLITAENIASLGLIVGGASNVTVQ